MKELTSGRPVKLIIGFALPVLLGLAFQQAYTLTDTIIIGRHLGENSLAAVGSTSAVVSLMFNIINGLVTGFAILIAKNFGAGNHEEMRRTIARTVTFSAAAAALIIVGIAIFIEPLLKALDTPAGIFEEAKAYLIIVNFGLAATLFYNLESAILRAVGDSVVPLIILIISTFLNIGLDFLMVVGLGMGVAGAALATVIAQLASAAVCLVYLVKKRPFLIVKPRDFKFTAASSAELLSAGCGMALMYSIVDIGSIVLQNGINGFGEDIIAAHTAARKLFSFTIMPFSSLSATLVTYSSQNRGAGKFSRIGRGVRAGLLLGFGCAAFDVLMIYTVGRAMVGIILPDCPQAVEDTAVQYLMINVPFYFCLTVLLLLRSTLQGLGHSIVPIAASCIELVWKICTVAFMIPRFGYMGVIISEPIIWTVCSVIIGLIALATLKGLPRVDLNEEQITAELKGATNDQRTIRQADRQHLSRGEGQAP